MKVNKFWVIWKYTLGSFSDEKTEEYDNTITAIRTVILFINLVTCLFIMANIAHNW